MIASFQPLSNPYVATALRIALGGCLIYMARDFYANPAASFHRSARWLAEYPWVLQLVRAMACFCLWGGCFILGTVVAVQFFGLHGYGLAVALVILSAIAAWFLLPKRLT
jgi:hypothetical protein